MLAKDLGLLGGCICLFVSFGGLESSRAAEVLESASDGIQLVRDGKTLTINFIEPLGKAVVIPRFCASIQKMAWLGDDQVAKREGSFRVTPEIETWKIDVSKALIERRDAPKGLKIWFDSAPLLLKERMALEPSGDGSFFIPACLAKTTGSKLRFEPQTYKNTVGYWTKPEDFATWKLKALAAGKYSVNILQGCGKGQGGSLARLTLANPAGGRKASLEFTVEETGHFQRFVWRHLGDLELDAMGELEMKIEAVSIAKAALMDVRAVHLVKLPN